MKDGKIVVAIVAPGGYAPDEAGLARALASLESDCVVHNFYRPQDKFERFGASDAVRLTQVRDAAADPQVDVVMALRGGYGVTRLLPHLDFGRLAVSGKLFVGHSDFTAFQLALLAREGGISFSGPMICDDFTAEAPSAFTHRHFWQCIGEARHRIDGGPCADDAANPTVQAEGMLWGGNLTMLTHLLGTPYFPQVDGGILFVEDVNEHPYRVERMLMQLLHAGVLQRQQAVLLGDFSSYKLSPYDNGYDFPAMLDFIRAQCPVPVLTGLPFGHTRDKVTLAVGCQARLHSSPQEFTLEMQGYPVLEAAKSLAAKC